MTYPYSIFGRTDPHGGTTLLEPQSQGTTVALNGSIPKRDSALRHATDNVASWNSYLPPDCVSRMMNDGWHWST